MPYPPRPTKPLIIGLALLPLCTLYYFIDPTAAGWPFRCLFKTLTGWECPGCGSQRALHALLHGQLSQAIDFNPFLCIALPYLLLIIAASYIRHPRAQRLLRLATSLPAALAYIAAALAYTLLRNLCQP